MDNKVIYNIYIYIYFVIRISQSDLHYIGRYTSGNTIGMNVKQIKYICYFLICYSNDSNEIATKLFSKKKTENCTIENNKK